MEIILKYKNRIAIGISVIAVIILIIFLFLISIFSIKVVTCNIAFYKKSLYSNV